MIKASEVETLNNYMVLTPNGEYVQHMLKFCEHSAQNMKKVLLITQHDMSLSLPTEKPSSLLHMSRWMNARFKDIESAPKHIIELYSCVERPNLIVFDLHSMVSELISRPVLQQCSRETLVRQIAKCAAAFCNFLNMLQEDTGKNAVDAIVVMPTEAYPLTPAQFKLLIGLYFSGNELFTNFSALSERIRLQDQLSQLC